MILLIEVGKLVSRICNKKLGILFLCNRSHIILSIWEHHLLGKVEMLNRYLVALKEWEVKEYYLTGKMMFWNNLISFNQLMIIIFSRKLLPFRNLAVMRREKSLTLKKLDRRDHTQGLRIIKAEILDKKL